MGDGDLLGTESGAEGGESLVVGGKNLSARLGVVGLEERLDVVRAEEELVEALVRSKDDLGDLGRVVTASGELVGRKAQEAGEELNLALVGGTRGDGGTLVLLVSDGSGSVVLAQSRVVELLGENFRSDPGREGRSGNENVDTRGLRVEDERASRGGTAEEGRHDGRCGLLQSRLCGVGLGRGVRVGEEGTP